MPQLLCSNINPSSHPVGTQHKMWKSFRAVSVRTTVNALEMQYVAHPFGSMELNHQKQFSSGAPKSPSL